MRKAKMLGLLALGILGWWAYAAGAATLLIDEQQVAFEVAPFVEQETVFVPVRPVFDKMGIKVAWENKTKTAICYSDEHFMVIRINHPSAWVDDETVFLEKPARLVRSQTVVPLSFFSALNLPIRWDAATQQASISTQPISPIEEVIPDIGLILAEPEAYRGKSMILTGEYQGWEPDPEGEATRWGPPVTKSDWGLDDGTGAIYVTGAQPDLDRHADIGKVVRVRGIVRLTEMKIPYLEAEEVLIGREPVEVVEEVPTEEVPVEETPAEEAVPQVITIGDILASPETYTGKSIMLAGEYRGWRPDPEGEATRHGPPVTRSDWGLDDGTGAIYVTGSAPDLHPVLDVGKRVRIEGVIKLTEGAVPYVEAALAEVVEAGE